MSVGSTDDKKTGIGPNVALLLGSLAYSLVNLVTLVLLRSHVIKDPLSVLQFFVFVAPASATAIALGIHFSLNKGFHPLVLAGFVMLMILAALINYQFWFQAMAAV